jgi:hypothetical protein
MEDRRRQRLIICCTPFGEDWTWFVQELTAQDVRWKFFSDERRYRWQGWVRRLNLNTPVCGMRAAWAARGGKADLLISIDPRFSFWTVIGCLLVGVRPRHMVFTFNFVTLPHGLKRRLFRFAFRYLDHIRVHSSMEKNLYHEHFGIPLERIRVALWSMNRPGVEPAEPVVGGDYLSAVGGNARDYHCLLEACRLAPEIPMAWVVRPENIAGMDLPPQVQTVCNVSHPLAMNYLAFSRATVIPLESRDTPCGHVTMVSAMYLGKAIVVTDSHGIADYVQEGSNGILCRPHDPEDLARCMRTIWEDRESAERMGGNGRQFAETYCNEALVREEMTAYLAEFGLARERREATVVAEV